jgi:hypothetical protein
LQTQKRHCEDELANLRDRNRDDLQEIDRLAMTCEQADRLSDELTSQLRQAEFDISKSLNKVEELNRSID